MFRPAWFLPLSSCTYLFEPPDLPTSEDPAIEAIDIAPKLNGVEVTVVLANPDEDVVGGTLYVATTAGDESEEPIMDVDWGSGVLRMFMGFGNTWLFPDLSTQPGHIEPDCENAGFDGSLTVTVVDAAGHESAPASQELVLESLGLLREDESLAPVEAPILLCVQFNGPTDVERSADEEGFELTTPRVGTYFLHVEASPRADLELNVRNADTDEEVLALDVNGVDPPSEAGSFTTAEPGVWVADIGFKAAMSGTFPPYVTRVLATKLTEEQAER